MIIEYLDKSKKINFEEERSIIFIIILKKTLKNTLKNTLKCCLAVMAEEFHWK